MLSRWSALLNVLIAASLPGRGVQGHKGLFKDQTVVLDLAPEDFKAQVIQDHGTAWVAMLYASWCGHCQHFAPQYTKYAKAFEGDKRVRFAACDCAEYGKFCSELGVHGYPTLRGFHWPPHDDFVGKTKKTPEEVARMGEDVDRQVDTWVQKHLPPAGGNLSGRAARSPHSGPVPLPSTPFPANLRERFVKGRTPTEPPKASSSAPAQAPAPKPSPPPAEPDEAEVRRRERQARADSIGDGGLAAARAAAAEAPAQLAAWPARQDDQPALRLVDAEVAILYSLRQGTFLKGEASQGPNKAFIDGKVLDELCAWLEFLIAALPSARAGADLEAFLGVARVARAGGGLSAPAWDEILDKRGIDRAPPQAGKRPEQFWRICSTYTCGLWTLFHILSLSVAQGLVRRPRVSPDLRGSDGAQGASPVALTRIHGFVDNFFGCAECAAHFLNTFDSCALGLCDLSATDDHGAAVWLSSVHNRVSARVASENDPCQAHSCSFGCLEPSGTCASFEGTGVAQVDWDEPRGSEGSALSRCGNGTACSSRGHQVFRELEGPGFWPAVSACTACWTDGSDGAKVWNQGAVYDQLVASYWQQEWASEMPGPTSGQLLAWGAGLLLGAPVLIAGLRYARKLVLRTETKVN